MSMRSACPIGERVRERLATTGVETIVHYPKAVPFLGAYAYKKHEAADFPVAFAHMNEMLSLPLFPEMKPEQVEYVVAQLALAVQEA